MITNAKKEEKKERETHRSIMDLELMRSEQTSTKEK